MRRAIRTWLRRPGVRNRANGGDRGATLVEYALVLSFLVLAGIGAVNLLDSGARREVGNQEDCVSRRPPPPSCQLPAVPPPEPPPPDPGEDPETPELPPDMANVVYVHRTEELSGTSWAAILEIELTVTRNIPDGDPSTTPIEGTMVQYEAQPTSPSGPVTYVTCTTGADGRCTLRYEVPTIAGAPASQIRLRPHLIQSDPQVSPAPPGAIFDAPPLPPPDPEVAP